MLLIAKSNSLFMMLNKCLFVFRCCVTLVYSEAILVNYSNSVKSEFLQGDVRFHLKFIYNLLWWRSYCLQNLGIAELILTVL